MAQRLTHYDTLGLQDVVKIDDLLILPLARFPNLSESLAIQKFGVVDVDSSTIARNSLSLNMMEMEGRYSSVRRETNGEPSWVNELPIHSRVWLRFWYATTQEDPLAIVNALPHTGVSYMVLDDGLCAEACRVFNIFRLQFVNQLGYLQAPWVAMMDQPFVMPLTNGTRYLHSLDVMMLVSLIGYNFGLTQGELNTLRVAGLTHDRGTPAGGDSVKLIDPKAFDEDAHYERLLREKTGPGKWNAFRDRFQIDEPQLLETILNRGLLGQVLDIADKLAYVARDIETCLGAFAGSDDSDFYVGTRALKEIIEEFPHVCSIWDSVVREGDQMVFTDPRRLIAFLKARIVLFRELYYHPRARFGEYLISRILVKRLYEEGRVTRDELLEMSDGELERQVDDAYGKRGVLRALSLKCRVESFRTRSEALAFKKRLEESGVTFSLVEDHLHSIKPGTHFLVSTREGPKKLLEACRGDVQELHEMATMLPAVHVYYLSTEDLGTDEDLVDLFKTLPTAAP